ncbi:hypothetical protein TeGR_g3602, partial [Tetraparma gracilis]
MSIPAIMEVWQTAHNFSSASAHHDAMRMFFTVQDNLRKEKAEAEGNAKMGGIVDKLLAQVDTELGAYKQLMEGNYFVALGVTRNSSNGDVKKAYRKLALKHHPDKVAGGGGCGGANDLFPMIQNAYEVLSDPAGRKKYQATANVDSCMRKQKHQAAQEEKRQAQEEKRRKAHEQHQKDRFERRQRAEQEQQRGAYKTDGPPRGDYTKPQYHEDPEDYYKEHQKKWEKRRAEEENIAWKKRMEEMRRRKAHADAEHERKKKKEDKEEEERRRKERKKRDEEWAEQLKERERKEKMKRIVKLVELRGMKPREIKERLVALGHDVKGMIEREDYVKKYCVVTGQKYVAAGEAPEPPRERPQPKKPQKKDDGTYAEFEERVRRMNVKGLKAFVIGRGGNIKGLVEKGEFIDAALDTYVAPEKVGGMGRTAFGRGGGGG